MHYVVQRLGVRPTRGWVAMFFIAVLLLGAAFWIGPLRSRPAQLRLLALSGDGRFSEYVGIPARWADTLPAGSESAVRFPLVLAVHNSGAAAAQPQLLSLSLPARYRVAGKNGPLEHRTTMGNPLARYELPVRTARLEPNRPPTIIPGVDTLWIEPLTPSLYCTALSDSVPEFVPAPPVDPAALALLRIFYSFEGRRIRQRQTGLLTVQVDPSLIRRNSSAPLPVFETVITKPEAPRPELGPLHYAGARLSPCGDPSQPIELHSALWETEVGGRFFVLYNGDKPRKYLFDLNRDSIIELEMWDADGDGKFEARRAARITVPGFLMPLPKPRADSVAAAAALAGDTVKLDSAWLRTFHDTLGGPLRFGAPRRPAPRTPPPVAAQPQPRPGPVTSSPGAPLRVDSGALSVFHASEAGPLRFQRAIEGDTARPRPRPRAQPSGPRLLGVPYNSGGRRDTIR
ncbi:MAG TPA: hypothetical protein VGC44_02215 [Longimicrobiales bacterium]